MISKVPKTMCKVQAKRAFARRNCFTISLSEGCKVGKVTSESVVVSACAKLPECDGRGGGNVEGIYLMEHRDAYDEVGIADGLKG